jgi:hypothetical protein
MLRAPQSQPTFAEVSNGVASGCHRRNPVGVVGLCTFSPKVARSSQPWALSRNPFGIHLRNSRKALGLALHLAR